MSSAPGPRFPRGLIRRQPRMLTMDHQFPALSFHRPCYPRGGRRTESDIAPHLGTRPSDMSMSSLAGTDCARFDSWQYVLPPNRPTLSSLAGIETYLANVHSGAVVAVLGSTVEFRDLLARLNRFEVVILEKWPEFKKRMDILRLH